MKAGAAIPRDRRMAVQAVLTGLTLVTVAIAFPAWESAGIFPEFPLIHFPLGKWRLVFPALILIWSFASLLFREKRIFHLLQVLTLIVMVLGDLNWLQPWLFLIFSFHLILLLISPEEQPKLFFLLVAIMLSSIYFWSGIHKLNPNFTDRILPWLLEPLGIEGGLGPGGYLIGLLEIFVGIGLWFKPIRIFALAGAIAMHLFILASIGPWGHNWNSVVWPWNLAMPLWAWLIFYRPGTSLPSFSQLSKKPAFLYVIIFFTLLPGFHSIGMWNGYLSFSLYSGKIGEAYILVPQNESKKLPSAALERAVSNEGWTEISLSYWSESARKIPVTPWEKGYREVTKAICDQFHETDHLLLEIYRTDGFETQKITLSCEELLEP